VKWFQNVKTVGLQTEEKGVMNDLSTTFHIMDDRLLNKSANCGCQI